jgi:hypothetical protein
MPLRESSQIQVSEIPCLCGYPFSVIFVSFVALPPRPQGLDARSARERATENVEATEVFSHGGHGYH